MQTYRIRPISPVIVSLLLAVLGCSVLVRAQQTEFTLDSDGAWQESQAPVEGTDEAVIANAEHLLAEGNPSVALRVLNSWISKNKFGASPYLPTAYRLRGDAKAATGAEYRALFDYETVARNFIASDEFVTVLEREFEIASQYLHGMKRRWLGLRVFSATRDGERLLFQIAERMPGSTMQERALLELGDYYFRQRELDMVTETYRVFLRLFPRSQDRNLAMRRQVDANAASYKGPAYDASGLREARELIQVFQEEYPNDAEQAGLNDARIARIDESLASEKLYTAKWYLSQNDKPAARLMLRRVVRQYPGTLSAQEAYSLLEKNGWSVGKASETSQPAPVETHNDSGESGSEQQETQPASSSSGDAGNATPPATPGGS
ncbi:MAG: outer membrane protein assembly factor BamD [Phycisphaeraceae bacterium]|nr:outer membrane protein assembly factor BamD [Phycisphaerales bacterium]MCB9860820.1 outer membrane protein assembly factor BamD [Phycisphaeraceae bacterium]